MEEKKQRYLDLKAKREKAKLDDVEYKEFCQLRKLFEQKEKPKFTYGNDPEWWKKHSDLMNDAANLVSNFIPGTNIFRGTVHTAGLVGALRVVLADTFGSDGRSSDALNMMARDLFLKMFRKYRGITSYQASDLGMVIIAGTEIIKQVAELERLYGICSRYEPGDQNFPYTLTRALGFSDNIVNHVRTNMSDFRYDLNYLINKAQKICIPKDWTILADRISLYGYVYKDHNSDKAQSIVFTPYHYGKFDETTFNSGSSIIFNRRSEDGIELIRTSYTPNKTMFTVLEDSIEAIVGSDSVQKIFGDLLTWFGEEQLITLLHLPEDYKITPVYSESILHKLHNADVIGENLEDNERVVLGNIIPQSIFDLPPSTDPDYPAKLAILADVADKYVIYQKDNIIHTHMHTYDTDNGQLIQVDDLEGELYCYAYGSLSSTLNQSLNGSPEANGLPNVSIIDTYHGKFNVDTVIEGCIWKPTLSSYESNCETVVGGTQGSIVVTRITGAGPEIVMRMQLYMRKDNNLIVSSGINTNYLLTNLADKSFLVELEQIDWHPMFYEVSGSGVITNVFGDMDNIRSTVDADRIRVLDQIILSAFTTDIKVVA